MSKTIKIDMKVSQDPLKGPSIGLMHMMAVKGKQRLLSHGTAVSCTKHKWTLGKQRVFVFCSTGLIEGPAKAN